MVQASRRQPRSPRSPRSRELTPINLKVLLPSRDCAAALLPGILTYGTEQGEVFLAIDQGAMVKMGMDVLISVRDAIGGTDLEQLHMAVKRQFLDIDQQEQGVRVVLAKMESGFIRKIMELQHE